MTKEGGSVKIPTHDIEPEALDNLVNMWSSRHHSTMKHFNSSYRNSIRYSVVFLLMCFAFAIINTFPLFESYSKHGHVEFPLLFAILGIDCLLYVALQEIRNNVLLNEINTIDTDSNKPLWVQFMHDLKELRSSIPHHSLAVLREFDCNMMHYRLEQWWLEIEEMFEMSRDAETELGREEAGSLALSEQERWQRMYDACARFMHMQPVQKLKCVEN